MDPVTHALTSFLLVRGFFPRRPWWFGVGVVLAGTIADLDLLSTFAGPAAYLSLRQTFTHSIWGTVAAIAVAVGIALLLGRKKLPSQQTDAAKNLGIPALLGATSLAGALHVLMDEGTSVGVALLWPWRATR